MLRTILLAAALAGTLAACASLPPPEAVARPARAAIQSFQIEGRIAVRRGEENFTARIAWQHAADSDEIVLSSPLGQGLARLSAPPAGARLETGDNKHAEAADLGELSEQVFGFRLPVSALP